MEHYMKEQVYDYFMRAYSNITRPGAEELKQWLCHSDFFEAPASTKYHLSEAGGLMLHSVHVYDRLKRLVAAEGLEYSEETIAIVGLLHDVCKVHCYQLTSRNQKTYDEAKVAAAQSWQVKHDQKGAFVWESVPSYEFNEQLPLGHGEKSVILILRHMELTEEEMLAIRWHMGPWQEGEARNVGNAFHQSALALLVHLADMQAAYLDEADM